MNTPEMRGRRGAGQWKSSEKLNCGKFGIHKGQFSDVFETELIGWEIVSSGIKPHIT